jgi:hypothetical protein
MIMMATPGKGNIEVTGEPFTRTLSLAGSHSSTGQQQRLVRVGNWVKASNGRGVLDYAVTAVSTDKLAWRDEYDQEHLTCDVLL